MRTAVSHCPVDRPCLVQNKQRRHFEILEEESTCEKFGWECFCLL